MDPASHLSDKQLLLDVDGELAGRDKSMVREHLDACPTCSARHQELKAALGEFVRAHEQTFEGTLPPIAGSRALLKARLAEVSQKEVKRSSYIFSLRPRLTFEVACLCGLLAVGIILAHWIIQQGGSQLRAAVVSIPDSKLTPGAALRVSRGIVCAQANVKNKAVSSALRRRVFEEYRIIGANPQAYEIDYLITPALGGSDDLHNLWPHSYSATLWNAHVKDDLEDHLRKMVCSGSLDLAEAQRDIAGNWIDAYKKYFHTDKPLAEH